MRSFLSVFLSMLAGFAGTAGLAQAAPPRSNPGQEAKTQQEAVISRYNNKKWTEAAELIEQFLLKFPSNENVPANCIRLAYCYQQTAQ